MTTGIKTFQRRTPQQSKNVEGGCTGKTIVQIFSVFHIHIKIKKLTHDSSYIKYYHDQSQ